MMGRIEVIVGCMFSGKTEELIRRVRRAMYAGEKVVVINHKLDERYAKDGVCSHNQMRIDAYSVSAAEMIPAIARDADAQVVAIDEAQFFARLAGVCEQMASGGLRVIAAGLNQDFRGVPFDGMPELLAVADSVTTLTAICNVCGQEATKTQRLVDGLPARADGPLVQIGGTDSYQARCREHHQVIGTVPHEPLTVAQCVDGIREKLSAAGMTGEDLLKGLDSFRETLYQERYGKGA